MPSLFDLPGAIVNQKQAYGTAMIYVFLVLLIVTIIFMLSSKKIDFSWLDFRSKQSIVEGDSELFWVPGAKFINLYVNGEKELKKVYDKTNYTINVEMILYETRNENSDTQIYRHLLHRGSNDLLPKRPGESAIPPAFGLPKRLNPGIFLDPHVNDLIVFVDTVSGTKVFRESVRIKDIPMDKPFRLGIILEGRVLEVYLNCKLEVTKVLSNQPKVVENDWYGLTGRTSSNSQIQNMRLWNQPLKADQIRPLCPSLPKFSKKPTCELNP
jgi:hypothetical protein